VNNVNDIIYCDTETYSEVPITNGTYAYAANAEVMIFTYAINDGEVQTWDATANPQMPSELHYALMNPKNVTVWHNSMFDRNVLKYSQGLSISPKRIHDTMVIALMHGLPGGLDKLGDVFQIGGDMEKDKAGKKLIHLFCKPRPKNMKLRRATSETHPQEWENFLEYARQDIVAMREIYKRLPKWNFNKTERLLWCLDQEINDRGFMVDIPLAENAIKAVNLTQTRLAKEANKLSEGEVLAATQRDKLLQYICASYNVVLPDLTKSTLERRINDPDLPDTVRELLAIRLDASTTSVSKYKKLVNGVNEDKRLRGTLQFCGAPRTGRWAGRTFQPQNLPRPSHSQDEIEFAIEALHMDCLDAISTDVMKLTSSALRSCIIASPGHKLVVSDLSNIEGRVAAYLAEEDWKINAFREFDEGVGEDLYKIAYGRSFNVDPSTVDKEKRQLGKVQELALGYGGGVGAFVTMVATYGMDLNQVADSAYDTIPEDIIKEATQFYTMQKKQNKAHGLSKKVFIVCDSLKRLWRNAQPAISSYWYDLENAVRSSINQPGVIIWARKIKVYTKGSWLRIVLPSGRCLCYPSAEIKYKYTPEDDEYWFEGIEKGQITYMGIDPYTRQWKRISTYGGKLFENICQAVARDVMAHSMPRVTEEGYKILLTVHDELITEARDKDAFNVDSLSKLMATPPHWAETIPLAAGGFEGQRYRKD